MIRKEREREIMKEIRNQNIKIRNKKRKREIKKIK